jgi:hypothetical protein
MLLGGIPAFAQGPIQIEVSAYGGVPVKSTLTQAFCCYYPTSRIGRRALPGYGCVMHARFLLTKDVMKNQCKRYPIECIQNRDHWRRWIPVLAQHPIEERQQGAHQNKFDGR